MENFQIRMTNFAAHPQMIKEGPVVGLSEHHTTSMTLSHLSTDKSIGLIDGKELNTREGSSNNFKYPNLSISTKPTKNSYRKGKVKTKDFDTMNHHRREEKERTVLKD